MDKTARLRELLKAARDIAAKAESDDRDLTAEERTEIETKLNEANTIKSDVKLEKGLAGLEGEIEALEGKPAGSSIDGAKKMALAGKSLGRAFAEHDSIKSWLSDIAPTGTVNEKSRIQSPPIGFDGLKTFGYAEGTGRPQGSKALVTGLSDTSAGALIDPDRLNIIDSSYERPLTVLDVITRGSTESDTVEYVRVTSVTNSAAPVPEATQVAESGDEEATKPESGIALQKITETVKTIAHWLPATKRSLSDASQVRTLIDNFLRYGLFEEMEDQIVNGDGTGENFSGILNTNGVQVQPWVDDLLATARKAKTRVKNARGVANAYLLHPNDAERLDLLKDDQGRYYYGGPAQDGAQPLWRLPVVETEAVGEGVGICGDFRLAVLWDREQAAISVSDSHNDFFIRNLVAILAELRAAFGIIRPAAFVQFPTTASESSA